MAAGSGVTTRSLQDTPTWALATVCIVFISLGLFVEHLIHLISQWLRKHRKTSLLEAVEKLRSVMMLLGFISLILTVTQRPISRICVSNKVAYSMLPCRKAGPTKTAITHQLLMSTFRPFYAHEGGAFEGHNGPHSRRLLAAASGDDSDPCGAKGMASIISQSGLNQLNTFIFVLAIMQIVYSVLTMGLGRTKMRRWKAWENETQTMEYLVANDPNRFRFARQTTFGRRHADGFSGNPTLLWVRCFFRQFFHSVAKVDYFTLRHGFISAHLSTNNHFNFRKYIQRSLEDDFKLVVGIRPFMWLLVVLFLLVDVHGWHVYLWISFLPLIVVLVVGTKLEVVVAKMAIQLQDQNSVIKGAPLVRPTDNLFWFGHPQLILTFLHYTLFMNAFEVAFFIWVTLQYGIQSCYHEEKDIIAIRMVLAVTVQVLCSYRTLPLYALVTQMGSDFKSAILEDQMRQVIKQWHAEVKHRRKKHANPPRDDFPPIDNSETDSSAAVSHRRMPTFGELAPPKENEIVEEYTDSLAAVSHRRMPTSGELASPKEGEIVEEYTPTSSQ